MKLGAPRAAMALAVTAAAAIAQPVPASRLGHVSGTSSEEFSGIYGMRELSDGRLLVTESGPFSRLVVLDFAKGSAQSIGRKGNGPGEFQIAGSLYALGGALNE
ncbi:MAG: hypothetical protein ABIW79_06090 [Gemmatimonas sp.]